VRGEPCIELENCCLGRSGHALKSAGDGATRPLYMERNRSENVGPPGSSPHSSLAPVLHQPAFGCTRQTPPIHSERVKTRTSSIPDHTFSAPARGVPVNGQRPGRGARSSKVAHSFLRPARTRRDSGRSIVAYDDRGGATRCRDDVDSVRAEDEQRR
jgi:hypothetical protein